MGLVDRLENGALEGRDGYKWDGQGWYGVDYHKIWFKSEGEGGFGEAPEQAEVQLLYSRALDPWFNLQAGIRHDFRPYPERTHLRSEEHTSELQSLMRISYAVFCLKKKSTTNTQFIRYIH